jgi:Fe-S cluster assembly ATP-binding protein
VNRLRRPDNAMILITHYQRLLNHIEPDHVHVLLDGRIVKSGDRALALELERRGYDWIREDVAGTPAALSAVAAGVPPAEAAGARRGR